MFAKLMMLATVFGTMFANKEKVIVPENGWSWALVPLTLIERTGFVVGRICTWMLELLLVAVYEIVWPESVPIKGT